MNDFWDIINRRADQLRQTGDVARVALAEKYWESHRQRQTDPEEALWTTERCRDEAQQLNEPWWVLYFDAFCLELLAGDLNKYGTALSLAMELMVRFSTPEGQAHPCNWMVSNNVLCIYLNVDPFGYAEELEQGFAHQDRQIPDSPKDDRLGLCRRWTGYLFGVERFSEAYDMAQKTLALADRSGDHLTRASHRAWSLYDLCRVCHALGQMDEIASHAVQMIELSKQDRSLRQAEADGWIWRAVTTIAEGNERKASQFFRRGMGLLKGLGNPISAEPTTIYYKLKGDWTAALGVCDKELAVQTKKACVHRCCLIQLERCRLLALAGQLTPTDLANARLLADRLRSPQWYLKRLEQFD